MRAAGVGGAAAPRGRGAGSDTTAVAGGSAAEVPLEEAVDGLVGAGTASLHPTPESGLPLAQAATVTFPRFVFV